MTFTYAVRFSSFFNDKAFFSVLLSIWSSWNNKNNDITIYDLSTHNEMKAYILFLLETIREVLSSAHHDTMRNSAKKLL
jgi:hypothetical protein